MTGLSLSLTAAPKTSSGGLAAPTAPVAPFQSSGFAQHYYSYPRGAWNGSTAYTCGDILLGWSAVVGATSYDIYEGATLISNTTDINYTISNPTAGSHTYSIYARQGPLSSSPFVIGPITSSACILPGVIYSEEPANNAEFGSTPFPALTSPTLSNPLQGAPTHKPGVFYTGTEWTAGPGVTSSLRKYNLAMSVTSTQPVSGGNQIEYDNGALYYMRAGSLRKFTLSTNTETTIVAIAGVTAYGHLRFILDNHYYTVTGTSLVKVNLSTNTLSSIALVGSGGFQGLWHDGKRAYVTQNTTIFRVDLQTFTTLTSFSAPYGSSIWAGVVFNGFIFYALLAGGQTEVHKQNATTGVWNSNILYGPGSPQNFHFMLYNGRMWLRGNAGAPANGFIELNYNAMTLIGTGTANVGWYPRFI